MIALLAKELRQLLPIAWLWLGVLVLGYAAQLLGARADEETFGSWCEGYCDPGTSPFVAAVMILFTLITAYALFPREHDESTIDFLRALPVARSRVFLVKVLAAWLLLVGVNLTSYGIDAALLATNPESLGGRFLGQVWWTLLWRDCVFAFVILAHGVVLSWFRTVGLVAYALYVVALLWLESTVGTAGLWSVFGVLANDYDGQRLVVDARAIGVHVVVAIGLLFAGYRLWSRTPSAAAGGGTPSRGRGGRWLRGAAAVAGFGALAVAALVRVGAETGEVADEALAVVETEHYRFVHRERDVRVVDYIVEHAEADLAGVARLLGTDDIPRIRVDLAASSEHAAGLATWKKIRMDLGAFEDDISQRRVLAHEAVHVLQSTESERALARHFATTRFFIEGMAQHVSFEVVPEPARRAANHALAAVVKARQDIGFDDLIDSAAFGERFDPELYYSLGDTWAESLVAVCGESVLGDFLRAAGRDDAPRRIGGELFWRDTFREIGCELDAVNSAWSERMETALAALDPAPFPAFDDIVVARDREAGVVRITARLVPGGDAPADLSGEGGGAVPGDVGDVVRPVRAVVRVRSDAVFGGAVDPVVRGTLSDEAGELRATFAVPARMVADGRFEYQLGYEPAWLAAEDETGGASDSRVLYEGWRSGSAP